MVIDLRSGLALTVIAAIALGMGCGSGSGEGSAAGTATGNNGGGIPGPDKAAYIDRANAACRRAKRQSVSLLATAEAELAALGSLGPTPEGDSAVVAAILVTLRRNLREARAESKGPTVKTEDYFLGADSRLIGFAFVDCII